MSVDAPGVAQQFAVAIVDDDASVRAALGRLCAAFGYRPAVYASGREFLSALDRDPQCADCLILDTHMPEMNGIELQRHLLSNGVHIPTIVVTADEALNASSHYAAADIVAYFVKPVSSDDLLAAVARAVRISPESLVR